ncbi:MULTISPECIES: prephenate dehydratase domain-containing protein [Alteromonadales]|jgi:prephenate dehydratase|uniref:prephenate dehydratase n=1 Tax=Alteromonadales TaxID=135622 RepID=UPI0020CD8B6F|nr:MULTISPECIES: prephenate dehydratase domain-containing protein [Alteromonadales]MCP4323875.1 ACT domain-containing protein [Alteromonadales bacterium]MCP4585884.1 ACT domain-containing protein [Pseudoalteromonas sp.]MCP5079378.1 ACT domain-containing protein [Psychromonas sp.]MCP9478736.1 ACT domain-containing protein [Marisediminitalea aggregata]|tara:strand:+ start:410 stop:1237 length:828 start_codon:yes stop_codon:yes gene_type:complete
MLKIVTLGPAGTFSELATKKFIQQQSSVCDVNFLPTIRKVLHEIGQSCDIGIIPIENFSEGFIALVLDLLVELDLCIVDEVMLPIEFSFVSNARRLKEIDQLFVQFVAQGQCLEFIQNLNNVNIHLTESNIESLEKCISANDKAGAIVPSGSFSPRDFASTINKVNDYDNNQTRFLALTKNPAKTTPWLANKTSIIVLDDDDHPGLLGEVLQSFSSRGINLTNIISRPTRRMFGKYHFFIEFEGNKQDANVAAALKEVGKRNKVKMLGSYKAATL